MTKSPSDIAAEILPCTHCIADPDGLGRPTMHDVRCLRHMRPAIVTAIEAAIQEERDAIVGILRGQMLACESNGELAVARTDKAGERLYWRADGAADVLEAAVQMIHSRSKEGK